MNPYAASYLADVVGETWELDGRIRFLGRQFSPISHKCRPWVGRGWKPTLGDWKKKHGYYITTYYAWHDPPSIHPGTSTANLPKKGDLFGRKDLFAFQSHESFFRTKAVSFREIQGKWPRSGKGKIHGTYTPQVSLVHRKKWGGKKPPARINLSTNNGFCEAFPPKTSSSTDLKKKRPGQWTTGSLRYEFALEKWVLCSVKDENLGCTKVQKISDFFPTFCTTR